MSLLDFLVLFGSMAGIAAYGIWKTRGRQELDYYLKGERRTGWAAIGLSVMATQASAVTFLSMPGQGYQDGLGFVQNYFGAPLALVIIAAVFLPIYRRLNVYTAYEYLGAGSTPKPGCSGPRCFCCNEVCRRELPCTRPRSSSPRCCTGAPTRRFCSRGS